MKKIILVLILVFVGFLAVFLTQKQKNPKVELQITPSQEQELNNEWLTYTNDKYAYEIKYHQDWYKQGENEPPYPPPPEGMNFSRKWENPLEICDFQISTSENETDFDGQAQSLSQDSTYQKTTTNIAGEDATKFSISNETQLVESYYFKHNGSAYILGFNILRGNNFNTCQQVFEQMLASFRFL